MQETQNQGWGKLLASTSRLFISDASVESSLSKTGTGRILPGGRIDLAEKLREKWANEMRLPPLSGCLWDSPSTAWWEKLNDSRRREGRKKGGVQAPSCMFLHWCLVSLFSLEGEEGGTSKSHGRSLICYIKADLHSPPSLLASTLFCKYTRGKLLWWHWWQPRRVVEMFTPPYCITSALGYATNPRSSYWPLRGETVWELNNA